MLEVDVEVLEVEPEPPPVVVDGLVDPVAVALDVESLPLVAADDESEDDDVGEPVSLVETLVAEAVLAVAAGDEALEAELVAVVPAVVVSGAPPDVVVVSVEPAELVVVSVEAAELVVDEVVDVVVEEGRFGYAGLPQHDPASAFGPDSGA